MRQTCRYDGQIAMVQRYRIGRSADTFQRNGDRPGECEHFLRVDARFQMNAVGQRSRVIGQTEADFAGLNINIILE